MKPHLLVWMAALLALVSIEAAAQTQQEHQQHHPGGAAPQTQAAPPVSPQAPSAAPEAQTPTQMPMGQMPMGQMMQGMPEHCRAMMQTMPQNCMSMMQQMMRSRMGGTMPGMQAQSASPSPAIRAYTEAAERMHGPMMEGLQMSDPDVAFVRGMIAHHQGAIDMAKVVLQYGKDDQAKRWANDVIREQQREIAEMQEWLKKRGG